jgi:hypothetical protein
MIEDIQRRIEFMRSLDREHVHLPISTVEHLMATAIGKVDKKALEKGKVKPVDKRTREQKINADRKAGNTAKGLKQNREKRK